MEFPSFYLYLLLALVGLSGVSTDCPPANVNDGTVTDYDYIEPEKYDRNYSQYSEDRRPLGFDKTTVYYGEEYVNPCIKVTDTGARMLEIMIQTTPSSDICIKRRKNAELECGNDVLRICGVAPASTTYIELLCPNCEESDINLWYRIRMSDKNDPDIENWCSNQILEYPRDLQALQRTLPADFTFPPVKDENYSANVKSDLFVISVVLSVVYCLIM